MQASSDLVVAKNPPAATVFDFDAVFAADYAAVTRLIARIVRDPGRAEEPSVETFWRLWKTRSAHGDSAPGWLRRTAVRLAIDELRRRARRERFDRLWPFARVRLLVFPGHDIVREVPWKSGRAVAAGGQGMWFFWNTADRLFIIGAQKMDPDFGVAVANSVR